MMKKLLVPLLTGIATFLLCAIAARYMLPTQSAFVKQISMKLALAIMSLLIAVYGFKLPLSEFSFTKPKNRKASRKFIVYAFLLGMLATACVLMLHLPAIPLLKELGFVQYIIAVWFFSSICEEVFARGLVQGVAAKYNAVTDPNKLSMPVLIGAVVFSLIHLGIYILGGSLATTIVIMLATFCLGIFCGLAKQKANMGAAILTHISFNVGGFVGGIIINIIAMMTTGHVMR
jgi:membrane protease YdiL (CAAX protease family)